MKLGSGRSKYGRKWRVNARSGVSVEGSVMIDIRELLEELIDRVDRLEEGRGSSTWPSSD